MTRRQRSGSRWIPFNRLPEFSSWMRRLTALLSVFKSLKGLLSAVPLASGTNRSPEDSSGEYGGCGNVSQPYPSNTEEKKAWRLVSHYHAKC